MDYLHKKPALTQSAAGRTPLMISLDSMPLLATLIDKHDADLDAVDKSGLTALHIAGKHTRTKTSCL